MGAACCCCGGSKGEQPPLGNPIKKRRCTDVLCLLIFFLYWGGMIAIIVYTILFGRFQRLLNGFDDYGNTCGVKNNDTSLENMNISVKYTNQDMTDRPYQFFTNYYNLRESYSICVKKCPDRILKSLKDIQNYYNESQLCDYSVKPEDVLSQNDCKLSPIDCFGPCPALEVPEEKPFFSRCLPVALIENPVDFALNVTMLTKIVEYFGQYRFFNEVAGSFYIVRYDLIYLMLIALGTSLLLVFLMRFVIKIVVWFIVIMASLAAIGGTVLLWITWYRLYSGDDPQVTHELPLIAIAVDAKKAFLTYSIVATVLTVILLLVIIVMRKRLQLAVALFQEAGKVLEHSPLLLIQPIWTYLFQIILIAIGLIMLVLCAGVTNPTVVVREDMGFGKRTVLQYIDRDEVTYFWWYIVIGVVWTSEFLIAVQELIIAGTVAEWFFTREKKSLNCTLCNATGRTIVYHLGSAAIGSFLITLIKIPRYILMKISAKLEQNKTNECAKFMLKCCICCLWCLEKCMKFINRNAYIVIAINSSDFCVARVKAFKTLLNNILRVAAINTVGDFVLFLGKVLVMSANIIIAFFLFNRHNDGKMYGDKNLFFLPTLAVAIISYLLAHCLLSSFEMIVDTLLLCFCEDAKVNDGTPERPYFMSKSLMKFVADSSKAINKQKNINMDAIDGGVPPEEKRILDAAGTPQTASVENVRLTPQE